MRVEELGGGVSNIVLAVSCEDTRVVVKQALPRLRVEDEWLAKRERAINEARALRLAHTITPGCVPALLDVDRELCTLTMTAAPSEWTTWKDRLLAGEADAGVARRLGEILAAWHGATFLRRGALASRTATWRCSTSFESTPTTAPSRDAGLDLRTLWRRTSGEWTPRASASCTGTIRRRTCSSAEGCG